MNHTEPERLTIRWATRIEDVREKIRKRFGIPEYCTLNDWSPVEIKAEDMEVFQECAKRGFFGILPVKWCKKGGHYIFTTR